MSEKEECVCCMEAMGEKDSLELGCGHKYHTACIARFPSPKCPVACDHIITEGEVGPEIYTKMTKSAKEFKGHLAEQDKKEADEGDEEVARNMHRHLNGGMPVQHGGFAMEVIMTPRGMMIIGDGPPPPIQMLQQILGGMPPPAFDNHHAFGDEEDDAGEDIYQEVGDVDQNLVALDIDEEERAQIHEALVIFYQASYQDLGHDAAVAEARSLVNIRRRGEGLATKEEQANSLVESALMTYFDRQF